MIRMLAVMTGMSLTQQIITVAAAVVATMLTRFIPFLLFRPGRPTPRYILYLGKVLPASVFALLVVYCLKNIELPTLLQGKEFSMIGFLKQDTIAQLIGVLSTTIVHAWRKNLMWSIAAGTLCYMILIRL